MDINSAAGVPPANMPLPIPAEMLSALASGRIPDISSVQPAPTPGAADMAATTSTGSKDRVEFSSQQSLDAVTRKIMKAMHEALKRMANERVQAHMEEVHQQAVAEARRQAGIAANPTDPSAQAAKADDTTAVASVDPSADAAPDAAPVRDPNTSEAEKLAGQLLSKLPTDTAHKKSDAPEPRRRYHAAETPPRINFDRFKLEKAQALSAKISSAIDASSAEDLAGVHQFNTADALSN